MVRENACCCSYGRWELGRHLPSFWLRNLFYLVEEDKPPYSYLCKPWKGNLLILSPSIYIAYWEQLSSLSWVDTALSGSEKWSYLTCFSVGVRLSAWSWTPTQLIIPVFRIKCIRWVWVSVRCVMYVCVGGVCSVCACCMGMLWMCVWWEYGCEGIVVETPLCLGSLRPSYGWLFLC